MTGARTLVVGIGSPHGDDAAGWVVADRLMENGEKQGVSVRKAKSPADLLDLLDWLDHVGCLIVCDACRGLDRPGQSRCWIWPTTEFAPLHFSGTHDLSLPAVLALARQLKRLPGRVVICGVEGKNRGAAESMSYEVRAAIPELLAQIMRELQNDSSPQTSTCMNDR